MGRIVTLAGVALLLVAIIAGLTYVFLVTGEGLTDYYPVGPAGRVWEYASRVTDASGTPWSGTSRTTLVGERTFEGQIAIACETVTTRSDPSGARTLQSSTTIYVVASKAAIAVLGVDTRTPDDVTRTRYSPAYPALLPPLRPGASWQWDSETRVLGPGGAGWSRAAGQVPPRQRGLALVVGREPVVVPAGRFETLKLEFRRSKEGEIVGTEWRAKGMGLVKRVGPLRAVDELRSFSVPAPR